MILACYKNKYARHGKMRSLRKTFALLKFSYYYNTINSVNIIYITYIYSRKYIWNK